MIKTKLYSHQEKARDFILANNGIGALFFDVGCGKTLTTLSVFEKMGGVMLVICPLSILENAWGGDISRFTNFTYCNIRKKMQTSQIYLANYEACLGDKFKKMLDTIKPTMLVLDESVRIKNPTALTTKAILKWCKTVPHRMILTGCPAPNNMMEYWSQISFLDSNAFNRSFYAFRNRYFHLQRGNQILPSGMIIARDKYKEIFGKGFKYAITDKNKEALTERMKPLAVWVRKEDCLDLPEQIDVVRDVKLSDEEMRCYKTMRDHLVSVIKQEMIAAPNALTKIIKLRQITSGFLINYEGQSMGFGSSKLRELQNTLDEIGEKQVIIWVNFSFEVKQIIEALKAENCAQIHGDVADKESEIISFTNGSKKYLVANPASASSGLNLQNCDTQIFYSLSYSYDDYYQCRGRTHRSGQKNTCVYIHLTATDTIDKDILDVLRNKEDAVNIVHRLICNQNAK